MSRPETWEERYFQCLLVVLPDVIGLDTGSIEETVEEGIGVTDMFMDVTGVLGITLFLSFSP